MPKFKTFPLIKQLVWPLVALLLILAGASTLGSILLLHKSLSNRIDEQLGHAQRMVYHDLKQNELRLADLLVRLGQKSSTPVEQLEKELRSFQPDFDLHLFDDEKLLTPPLRQLSRDVEKKQGGLRVVTLDDASGEYALTFVAPAAPPRRVGRRRW